MFKCMLDRKAGLRLEIIKMARFLQQIYVIYIHFSHVITYFKGRSYTILWQPKISVKSRQFSVVI